MPGGIRVLVVEDHVQARKSLGLFLGELPGVRDVLLTDRGELGVRLALEAAPDLVLLDLRLPDMDGVEATRRIRQHAPQLEIVAMSALGEERIAALSAGADAFVDKIDLTIRLASIVAGVVRKSDRATAIANDQKS